MKLDKTIKIRREGISGVKDQGLESERGKEKKTYGVSSQSSRKKTRESGIKGTGAEDVLRGSYQTCGGCQQPGV